MIKKSCVCIILARGGSKGVPRKNLRHIAGVSLVARSVLAARNARGVDAVYVSTDDAEIAQETRRFGGQVIERPNDISGDKASSEAGWIHGLEALKAAGEDYDQAVFLQCTSPFTTGDDIDGCLAEMDKQGADCALSVQEDHSFLWTLDEDGFGVGVNHAHLEQRKRRQDLPPSFCESGAIYAVDAKEFLKSKQRFFGKVALFQVDHPPVEIDTLEDFALCSQIAQSKASGMVGHSALKSIQVLIIDGDEQSAEPILASEDAGMALDALSKHTNVKTLVLANESNLKMLLQADSEGVEICETTSGKESAIVQWLEKKGASWEQVLYVGGGASGMEILPQVAIAACPHDSEDSVFEHVNWVVPRDEVNGAVRVICDALVDAHRA